MKNRQLFSIIERWDELKELTGNEFLISLRKNKRMIDAHLEDVNFIKEESEEYKAFKKEYLELRKEYSDKDKEGNPKFMNVPQNPSLTTYLVSKRKVEFAKVEKDITEKYSKDIKANEEKFAAFEDALDLECGIIFTKIKPSSLPKAINNGQMDVIDFMIDFDESKTEKDDQ